MSSPQQQSHSRVPSAPELRATERNNLTPAEAVVSWGDFTLTGEDITRFRAALATDFPGAGPWTDDEIRRMAYDSLHLVTLLLTMAREQRGTASYEAND